MNSMDTQSILISVRPAFANLLVNGTKTVELRRRFPQEIKSGTRIIIYATLPVGKVIGECRVLEVRKQSLDELWRDSATKAMVPWEFFKRYFDGVDYGYAIHVNRHLRYREAQPIEDVAG